MSTKYLLPILLISLTKTMMVPDFQVQDSPHDFDYSKAGEWLENAKQKFNPDMWNYTQTARSFGQFEEFMKEDLYVFFYNKKDESTYSKAPFYRTTCNVLFDNHEKVKCITVDMEATPQIPKFFGLHPAQTLTIYFKDKAPIPVNMDNVKQSRNPVGEWMERIRSVINQVVEIKEEDDVEVFEEEAPIAFLVVEEGNEEVVKIFSGMSANYSEMVFAYLVRNDETEKLESMINEKKRLLKSGKSKITNFFRNYNYFQSLKI